jgi:hypothetical protein
MANIRCESPLYHRRSRHLRPPKASRHKPHFQRKLRVYILRSHRNLPVGPLFNQHITGAPEGGTIKASAGKQTGWP